MSETDPLQGSRKTIKHSFHIEYLRAFGLVAGLVMIETGKYVSKWFNEYPVTDEPKNSALDIIFHGAESNFHPEDTYIRHLFHFIHTCVYIDNNPAKTVAAILIQVAMLPLFLFIILNYHRIMLQEGPQYEKMKKRALKVAIFEMLCCAYFFLCLVNSPIQDRDLFTDSRANIRFAMHYFPYLMFQTFEFVAALEQVNFLCLQDKLPLPFATKNMLNAFFYFFFALYVLYFFFMWVHIIWGPGSFIWDAGTPVGKFLTDFIMYAYLTCGAVIPSICAFYEAKQTSPTVIEISLGPSPS